MLMPVGAERHSGAAAAGAAAASRAARWLRFTATNMLLPLLLVTVAASSTAATPTGLTFMAHVPLLDGSGSALTVWEDLRSRDGALSFYKADNATLVKRLTKRDVDAGQLFPNGTCPPTQPPVNDTCCGFGLTLNETLVAGADLLGQAVLSAATESGDDPIEAEVEGALPPFSAAGEGGVAAFVGSRKGPAYPLKPDGTPIQGTGWTHPWRTPYFTELNTSRPTPLANPSTAGILGGWHPTLRWTFDEPCGPGSVPHGTQGGYGPDCNVRSNETVTWEQTIVGEVDPPSAAHQSVFIRWIRYSPDTRVLLKAVYVDTNQPYPSSQLDDPEIAAAFYREVLKTANSYDQLFGLTPSAGSGFGSLSLTADLKVAPSNPKGGTDRKPMTVVASNPAAMRLIDQSRHSLVREWIARRDVVWGAYGIAPDLYGGTESDGFQENLNSGVSAAMAWGFLGTAREILSSYWRYMVRSDGGVKYRGAMLPGYGRMLTHTAQYIDVSGDATLLAEIQPHLDAVVHKVIMPRLDAARKLSPDHIAHGIPLGCDEADSCTEYSYFVGTMGELPYFSGAMEVWRGLTDLGKIYSGLPNTQKPAEGKQLLSDAETLAGDIARSWAASVNTNDDGSKCFPYVAGAGLNRSIPLNNCTRVEGMVPIWHPAWHPGGPQTTGAQFKRTSEPWRAYSEMYHSGYLNASDIKRIHEYAMEYDSLARLGSYGGVNIPNALFGHTAYGEAYGLVLADLVPEFLLFLYGQSHHVYTKGTWTGFEKTRIDRGGGASFFQYFAAPAQLTVPTALRWALVFDDPPSGEIALGRMVPRAWFEKAGASLAVAHAPVSRQLLSGGAISFSINATTGSSSGSGGGGSLAASVVVDGAAGAGPMLKRISLRFRVPLAWGKIKSVSVGGVDATGSLGGPAMDTLSLGPALPTAAALANIKVEFVQQ